MNNQSFVEALKQEINQLSYNFKDDGPFFKLTINEHDIAFKKVQSDFRVKPNNWMRRKHKDNQIHEPGLVATIYLLSKIIDKDITFFDVGALFGYHSMIANSFFSNCHCVTIEGNPLSNQCIQEITSSINNITNINCVIGSKKFSTRYLIDGFRFIPSDEGQRNFSETVSSNLPEFQIETVTLKDIFSNNKNGNQEIYKIDTEGHQCTFIPPFADDLCSRNAILLMELDRPQRMSEFGKTNQDVLDPFFKNGYTGFWLDHRTVNTKVKEFKSIDSEMDKNSLAIMIPPKYLDSIIYK